MQHKTLYWCLVFQQGGYNIRMKAVHFLNAAPFTYDLISMVKIALKRKRAGRVSASYTLHTLHIAITCKQGKCKLYNAQSEHSNNLQAG